MDLTTILQSTHQESSNYIFAYIARLRQEAKDLSTSILKSNGPVILATLSGRDDFLPEEAIPLADEVRTGTKFSALQNPSLQAPMDSIVQRLEDFEPHVDSQATFDRLKESAAFIQGAFNSIAEELAVINQINRDYLLGAEDVG